MEPVRGFEPLTCGLRNRCSATELHRRQVCNRAYASGHHTTAEFARANLPQLHFRLHKIAFKIPQPACCAPQIAGIQSCAMRGFKRPQAGSWNSSVPRGFFFKPLIYPNRPLFPEPPKLLSFGVCFCAAIDGQEDA